MRDASHGDEIDTGLRDLTHRIEVHATRRFGDSPASHVLDDVPHVSDGHVVEEDRIGARAERFSRFLPRGHFDLYTKGVRDVPSREFDDLRDGEVTVARSRDVIIFDQHTVREIEPMVLTATKADRVALQFP